MARVLVVEDEPQMRLLLERALVREGHLVEAVERAESAMAAVRRSRFDVAAVDVGLPGMSGTDFCRQVRAEVIPIALVLVTARDSVDDRITGLDSGADDYVVKPVALGELAARVRALLRRSTAPTAHIRVGDLLLDPMAVRATVRGRVVPLSVKEFGLLRVLATGAGEPQTRADVLREVWGDPDRFGASIVDQYVSYVRRKLDLTGSNTRIETVRGVGYRLVPGPR